LDGLVISTSQYGCYNCDREAMDLPGNQAAWAAEGLDIVAITLMIENPSGGSATLEAATVWRDNFGLTGSYVAYDPSYSLIPPGTSFGTPRRTFINPRTMEILATQEGGGSYGSMLDYARLISSGEF
jgi:hypothetical protein